jgi:ubiquinone/menaquinone biosynthesis C-methylase UbiE
MPATGQVSKANNARVSAHWDQQFAKTRADNACWINNHVIVEHLYRLISGGSSKHWLQWLLEDYFHDLPVMERSLSICCGDGSHELILHQSKKVKFVRGFDISDGAVRQAKEKFVQAGAASGTYLFEVKDANCLNMRDRFDLILSSGALHHVTALEDLLDKLHAMLQPNGYFAMLEFVGPNRFQWTDHQCQLINGVLAQLDPRYLKNGVRPAFGRPPIAEMLRIDPSEAVRSQDVLPLVRGRFETEYESEFNGTLVHMLYPLLNAELANRQNVDYDTIVRLLLYFEDVLVRSGVLPSDFVFLVCRRKDRQGGKRRALPPKEIQTQARAAHGLVGFVDVCTPAGVSGWAADLSRSDHAVSVDIWLDDRRLGQVSCTAYRQDVRDAGYGNGHSGFSYRFPPWCRPTPGARLKVLASETTILVANGVVTAA